MKTTSGSLRRPRLAALSLATTAVLVLTGCGREQGDDPQVSSDPVVTASPTPSKSPSTDGAASPTGSASATDLEPDHGGATVDAMLLGKGPRGPVLFRQQVGATGTEPLDLLNAITVKPAVSTFSTFWAPGSFVSAQLSGATASVDLSPAAAQLPAGATPAQARMSLQQVVWSLRQSASAAGTPVKTVLFTINGAPATTVLGQPVEGGTVKAANAMRVLSKMQIDSPTEGQTVGTTFTMTGTSNGFEAWVGWQLLSGSKVVKEGFGTAEGWMDKNYPFSVEVDLTSVAPGTYTLRAHTEDASDGEGVAPDQDMRTIIVK